VLDRGDDEDGECDDREDAEAGGSLAGLISGDFGPS
jgi:hypothetical protein